MKVKNTKRLGQLALEDGAITRAQLAECLEAQAVIAKVGCSKKLGEILVEKEFLSKEDLQRLLTVQRSKYQTRKIGDYELGAKLGQGGVGAVLKARRISDGATVALKFFNKAHLDRPGYLERFEREADVATKLFHPNLVRTYGVEQLDSHRVLVMEYVDGTTLARHIKKRKRLDEQTALNLAIQLAQALAYLNSKRLIHRDIKPSNVMVDGEGNAKLLDLGLARREDEESPITMTGQVIGTPDFMAPEQISGKPMDVRTDVYALGATLYMMTTGRAPYAGRGDHQATLMAHLAGNYADPREFAPDLSEAAVQLIANAMATRPEDRYQDMESLAADIDAVLRGKAIDETTRGSEGAATLEHPAVPGVDDRRTESRTESRPESRKASSTRGAKRPRSRAAGAQTSGRKSRQPMVIGIAAVAVSAVIALIGLSAMGPDPGSGSGSAVAQRPAGGGSGSAPTPAPTRERSIAELHKLAFHARARGDLDGALKTIDEAIRRDPTQSQSHYVKAMIHLSVWTSSSGRAKEQASLEAGRAASRAIQLDQKNWHAWLIVGQLLADRGDLKSLRRVHAAMQVAGAPSRMSRVLARRIAHLERLAQAKKVQPPPVKKDDPPPVKKDDPPPVKPVDPTPEERHLPLPAASVATIEKLAADWRFDEARKEAARWRGKKEHARALATLDAWFAEKEENAHAVCAEWHRRTALGLAEKGEFGKAVNAVRTALAHTRGGQGVQRLNVLIHDWRVDARKRLEREIGTVKNFLSAGAKKVAMGKLDTLSTVPELSGYLRAIQALRRQLDSTATPGTEVVDAWLKKLPEHPPFLGEVVRRPTTPCATCEGKGHRACGFCKKGKVHGACTDCTGTGDATCGRCKGTGQQKCRRCKGDGRKMALQKKKEVCHHCKGSRRVRSGRQVCPTCKGVGTVENVVREEIRCTTCRGTGRDGCKLCRGSGTRACATCKSTGKGLVDHILCGGHALAWCEQCRGQGAKRPRAALPRRSTLPELPAVAREAVPVKVAGLFARRMEPAVWIKRRGGANTEAAVVRALVWLQKHQDKDGGWSGAAFMRHDPPHDVCTGQAKMRWVDPGLTGLSTLAFLGYGQTHQRGRFKDCVGAALEHLVKLQAADGLVGGKRGHYLYNHAIVTMALAEAYGMTLDPGLRGPAQKAVDYLTRARNRRMAWRYRARDGDNDTSVTGWCVMALKSAAAAGLNVDGLEAITREVGTYLESMTDTTYYVTGYKSRPPRGWQQPTSSRFQNDEMGVNTTNTHKATHTPTAIAATCRVFLGYRPNDPRLAGSLTVLDQAKPTWHTGGGGRPSQVDYYYWYYASLAVFHGGSKRQWDAWNSRMKKALLGNQRSRGSSKGSWDPLGAWGFAGGRVYATAINALTLETYYRYVPGAR